MKITIPESWNEVSLDKYREIVFLEDNSRKTDNIISILTDTDVEVISKMSRASRDTVLRKLEWVNSTPDEKRYNVKINIDGEDLFLINFSNISVGDWIDLSNYCTDYNNNLHKIFSKIYRKENGSIVKPEVMLDKVNIGEVYGALVFFSLIGKVFLLNTLNYSMNQTKKSQ